MRNVTSLQIEEVENDELPFRVKLITDSEPIYGAGVTLSKALMAAFSVSGLFPNKHFPYRNNKELARFIFFNFSGGENWQKAISALENE